MTQRTILVDAGPLVALIHARDNAHAACKATLARLKDPLATTWPVITEVMYLLRSRPAGQEALWGMLESGGLGLLPLDAADAARMRELMRRWVSLPMDLADASLVRVAEREKLRRVWTLDRRDFGLYRPKGLGPLHLVT